MSTLAVVRFILSAALVCALAVACGSNGEGDESASARSTATREQSTATSSQPLTVEEYFDRLVGIQQDLEEDAAPILEELDSVDPLAASDDEAVAIMKQLLPGLVSPIETYVGAVSQLSPPPEVAALHAEFTADLRDQRDRFVEAVEAELPDVQSPIGLLEIFIALVPELPEGEPGTPCYRLEDFARSRGINVDLRCDQGLLPGEEAAEPEPPAGTRTPRPLDPQGPELSLEAYLRRVEEFVSGLETGFEGPAPESPDASREQAVELVDGAIAAYQQLYDNLSALNPPGEAAAAHQTFTEGVLLLKEYYVEFDELTADSSQEIWQFFFAGLVFGSAYDLYIDGCLQLRDLAEEHLIQFEISCPFN